MSVLRRFFSARVELSAFAIATFREPFDTRVRRCWQITRVCKKLGDSVQPNTLVMTIGMPGRKRINVTANYDGKIKHIKVKKGDNLLSGDELFLIEMK